MSDTASIVIGIVSCVISLLAVLFGYRSVKQRERADAEEDARVLAAARALAGKGDETRHKIEAATEVAREREAAIHSNAANEVRRDPVERANEIIEAARARNGDAGRVPDVPAGDRPPRRVP